MPLGDIPSLWVFSVSFLFLGGEGVELPCKIKRQTFLHIWGGRTNIFTYTRRTNIFTHKGWTNIFPPKGGTNIFTPRGGANIFAPIGGGQGFYVGRGGNNAIVDGEEDMRKANKLFFGARIFRGPYGPKTKVSLNLEFKNFEKQKQNKISPYGKNMCLLKQNGLI